VFHCSSRWKSGSRVPTPFRSLFGVEGRSCARWFKNFAIHAFNLPVVNVLAGEASGPQVLRFYAPGSIFGVLLEGGEGGQPGYPRVPDSSTSTSRIAPPSPFRASQGPGDVSRAAPAVGLPGTRSGWQGKRRGGGTGRQRTGDPVRVPASVPGPDARHLQSCSSTRSVAAPSGAVGGVPMKRLFSWWDS